MLALARGAIGETFALDGPGEESILQVAETVAELVGDTSIERVPGRNADFTGRQIDITHAREVLGWKPETSFVEGVRRYLEWLRAG